MLNLYVLEEENICDELQAAGEKKHRRGTVKNVIVDSASLQGCVISTSDRNKAEKIAKPFMNYKLR